MNFQLSYAGVPLLTDTAKVIRMPPPEVLHGQTEAQQPIRRQQPEVDLTDEINRLIELGHIKDNGYPNNYPGKTLSNLAKQWPIYQWPDFPLKIGDWYYPHGANQWSVFRGLATSSMVQAMLNVTLGFSSAPFIMQAAPISPDNPTGDATDYTLITNLYLLPPRPLAEHGGQYNGLYLLTLVDERFYWQGTNSTLRVNQTTQWMDLLTQLATDLGISLSIPTSIESVYGQPEADSQLWTNMESSAVLLDAIGYNLGRTLVRNLDGTYVLLTADESAALVQANRGPASSVVRLAGGDLFANDNTLAGNLNASRNSVLPQSVVVSYPKYVIGNDPVPHFLNPRYANPRPTAWEEDSYGETWNWQVPLLSGGIGSLGISGQTNTDGSFLYSGLVGTSGLNVVLHDTAKALYLSEAATVSGLSASGTLLGLPLNQSGLAALSMQLAHNVFTQVADAALDEVYPGTYAWQPDGIHDLLWTYSDRRRLGATRVVKPQWNGLVPQYQHGTPLVSGSVQGVGGHSVAQTWRDLSGHVVYGANLVTVLGGNVSGRLYSGGIQEAIFQISSTSSSGLAFYNYRVPAYLISGGLSSGNPGTTSGPVLVDPLAIQFYSDPANFATWQNFTSGTVDGKVMLVPGVADHGPATAGQNSLVPAVPLNPQGNTRSQWGDVSQDPNTAAPGGPRQAYGLVAPYPQNWAGIKWFNDGVFVGKNTAFLNSPTGRFYCICEANFGSDMTIAAGVGSGNFLASGGPRTYFPQIFIEALNPFTTTYGGNGQIAQIQFQTILSGTGFTVGPAINAFYDNTHTNYLVSGFPLGTVPVWDSIQLDSLNVNAVGGLSVAGLVGPNGDGLVAGGVDCYLFIPVSASGTQVPPFDGWLSQRGVASPGAGFLDGAPIIYNQSQVISPVGGSVMLYDYNLAKWLGIPTGDTLSQLVNNIPNFNSGRSNVLRASSGTGFLQWVSG